MIEIYKRERSVTKAFAHYGIGDYTRKETRITARLPNTNEARLLELPRSQPLLVTESVNIDAESRAIEIGRASCRERGCQYVEIVGVAGSFTQKRSQKTKHTNEIKPLR